jgi:hypothetical protein
MDLRSETSREIPANRPCVAPTDIINAVEIAKKVLRNEKYTHEEVVEMSNYTLLIPVMGESRN